VANIIHVLDHTKNVPHVSGSFPFIGPHSTHLVFCCSRLVWLSYIRNIMRASMLQSCDIGS